MAEFVVEGSNQSFFVAVQDVVVSGPHSRLLALDKRDEMERQASWRERPCLCCREVFLSQGAHNRLCNPCRTKSTDQDWMN